MTTALREQLKWCTTGMNFDVLEYINMFRPLVHWYNKRRMNRYLSRDLNRHYLAIQDKEDRKNKSVVDLTLKSYLTKNPLAAGIDSIFRDFTMAQIKLFVFAGHSTTSSGTIFTYHLLTQHPDNLSKIRAEHDSVFSCDISTTTSALPYELQLLDQLPYTLAIIKESPNLPHSHHNP